MSAEQSADNTRRRGLYGWFIAVQPFAENKGGDHIRILRQGDSRVTRIINRKKISEDAGFRISLFTYLYSENGRYLITNTLTREVIELTEAEWKALHQIRSETVNFKFVAENGLEQLVVSRYIVEEEFDEVGQYKNVVFIMKTVAGKKKGYSTYTIWPTTGCNARCIYCFEESFKSRTMTAETADRVVGFINDTRQDGEIEIKWFGGEPLLGHEMISYICRKLKEKNISFVSTMITNGSLVTEKLAKEISSLWNMKRVQISLDGDRTDYERRKRYCAPDKYNYDTVIKGIRYLAAEGLKINIRCNVDSNNIDGLAAFADQLKADIGDIHNIYLYLSPLFGVDECRPTKELFGKMAALTEYFASIGLVKKKHNADPKFKVNYCIADSMDTTIGIGPDGELNNCDSLLEQNVWGNIFDGVTDKTKLDELYSQAEIDEACGKCCFLPQCTPFYKQRCPLYMDECFDYKIMTTERMMHDLLKGGNTETDDEEEL